MSTLPIFKITIVGDGNVGKTSLIRRYCEGKFEISRAATIGVDFQTKVVHLPSGNVKLSIWDLAGQDHFKPVRRGFYGGSRATALVFDVTNPTSFYNLERWRQEVVEAKAVPNFLLVGNKIDRYHDKDAIPADLYAAYINAPYLSTSALNAEGVEELFSALAILATGENLVNPKA